MLLGNLNIFVKSNKTTFTTSNTFETIEIKNIIVKKYF